MVSDTLNCKSAQRALTGLCVVRRVFVETGNPHLVQGSRKALLIVCRNPPGKEAARWMESHVQSRRDSDTLKTSACMGHRGCGKVVLGKAGEGGRL